MVACTVKITFDSLWFNMASVDIINFENKYMIIPIITNYSDIGEAAWH